eukprot:150917-Prymnesium_polylepis.1
MDQASEGPQPICSQHVSTEVELVEKGHRTPRRRWHQDSGKLCEPTVGDPIRIQLELREAV